MTSVAVRRWTEHDIPAVRAILRDTWDATYGGFIPQRDLHGYLDTTYAPEKLSLLMQRPEVEGFVAFEGEVAAGMVRTEYNPGERRFYVSSLYVLPAFQGRGIGSALLRRAEECALARGVHEVWLGVMEQNAGPLEWYRAIGFRFVRKEPFTMGTTTVNHLIGYRPIAPRNSVPPNNT